jgi:hypothetical protein
LRDRAFAVRGRFVCVRLCVCVRWRENVQNTLFRFSNRFFSLETRNSPEQQQRRATQLKIYSFCPSLRRPLMFSCFYQTRCVMEFMRNCDDEMREAVKFPQCSKIVALFMPVPAKLIKFHPKLQCRTHFQRSELGSEQKTHFSYINTASGGKKYTQQNPSQEKPKKTLRRLLVLGEVRQ